MAIEELKPSKELESNSNSASAFQEFNQFTITFKGNHIIAKLKITDGH